MESEKYELINVVLAKLLRSRNLKSQMYRTLIKSIVTYGSETWSLRKMDEIRVLVFEKKVLKKIYGSCKTNLMNGKYVKTRKLRNCIIGQSLKKISPKED